jgi:hypothetical protein
LRAEGFSCIFVVLQGGLEISKLPFLIKKDINIFLLCYFNKTLDPDPDSLEILDPDPDLDSMNLDPQH